MSRNNAAVKGEVEQMLDLSFVRDLVENCYIFICFCSTVLFYSALLKYVSKTVRCPASKEP